jgi:hypothetical protein
MKRKNDFQKKPVFYGMFETEWGNCYVGGERKTIGRMTLIFRGPKEKAIERLRRSQVSPMSEYHKIQSLFKREMFTKSKALIEGEWTLPEFKYLANSQWMFTEKVDGTNIRVMYDAKGITFGGRTDSAQIHAPLVARLNQRFLPLRERLDSLFPERVVPVVFYGEGYGAKIQKGGGNYRPDQDFVLFDVLVGRWFLQRHDVEYVAQKLGLDIVPIIGTGTLHEAVAMAKEGIQSVWGDFQAEGIVARPLTELKTRAGDRIIAKVKCRDFAKAEPVGDQQG